MDQSINPSKTAKDLWVEMSIREIWTQAHFAEIAFKNIDIKVAKSTDIIFSSIHSFLSHCAMVSKMLMSKDDSNTPKTIGNVLKIPIESIIHKRKFRNNLEHYDQELKRWINHYGVNSNIGTYNVGPKSTITAPNMIYVSHFDPDSSTFTFVNKDFDLRSLRHEVSRIKEIADNWVKSMENNIIITPFI